MGSHRVFLHSDSSIRGRRLIFLVGGCVALQITSALKFCQRFNFSNTVFSECFLYHNC
uniref:Uncharacterized protein n=1 Tax=Anguilla anguilla TaxID=7936 RepID=A0A0E9WMW1_ANGAN